MINLAICDDEIEFCDKLENLLIEIAKQENIQIDIDIYLSGSKLLNKIQTEQACYDMIFLDIEMEGMNGLEIAKEIRKQDQITMLIYVTSHQSYAIEAYEVQPFRFLLKPVDKATLNRCFMKAYEKITAGDFYFQYKFQKNYYKVLVSDILYFESDLRVIWIHLKDGSVRKLYDKLNNIEKHMKDEKVDFFRLHKSFLVNSRYIIRKAYDHVELTDGTMIDISEDRRKEINRLYMESLEGDMNE